MGMNLPLDPEIFVLNSQRDCNDPERISIKFEDFPGLVVPVQRTDSSQGQEALCINSSCVPMKPFPVQGNTTFSHSWIGHLPNEFCNALCIGLSLKATWKLKLILYIAAQTNIGTPL